MIYHLVTERNDWPPIAFFQHWGRHFAERFRTGYIYELARAEGFPVGTYIFSDLEMLYESQRRLLHQVWNILEASGRCRLLNNPARVKGRFELLELLYREGINDFRCFRIDSLPDDLRFPIFIRLEKDHQGSRTPLITRPDELRPAMMEAVLGADNPNDLMVVEYTETVGSDGLYRKYGAFRIGGRTIPRLINFSRKWVCKSPDVATDQTLAEEAEWVRSGNDIEKIDHIFALAGVDYGRVDFSFSPEGQMRVWEVNTNPMITHQPAKYSKGHLPTLERVAGHLLEAFEAIDTPTTDEFVRNTLALLD